MSRNISVLSRLCLVFIIIVFGKYVIVAQNQLSGTWETGDKNRIRAAITDDEDRLGNSSVDGVNLNFRYRDSDGGENNQNLRFAFGEIQGLTKNQVESANSKVNFRIVREAGTIECEGVFRNGRGDGTFRFAANQQFVSAMKSRGFSFEDEYFRKSRKKENRLFAAMIFDITTAFADDLLSANFGKLDTDDLFKARIFKINSAFMREMKASGFPNLGMEELVKARIFKIDGAYLKELNAAGLGKEPFENIVKMRIFKITPEFVAEVKREGFTNPDIEDLVEMRIFNIDGAFIKQAKSEGVPLEVGKLVNRRIGVWKKYTN